MALLTRTGIAAVSIHACVAAVLPSKAWGHELPDSRVLVVTLTAAGLEVGVSERTQPGAESTELRRRFDADGDRRLGPSERDDLARFLRERALLHLRVEQDGKALPLQTGEPSLRGGESAFDRPETLSVDVVVKAAPKPDSGGAVRVNLRDWRGDGHPVPGVIVATGVRLRAARAGRPLPIDRKTGAAAFELGKETTLSLDYVVGP